MSAHADVGRQHADEDCDADESHGHARAKSDASDEFCFSQPIHLSTNFECSHWFLRGVFFELLHHRL